MILLDTNVLIYALGSEHPLREPSRRVADAGAAGRVTTAIVVLQEFLHVFGRTRSRSDAAAAARAYAEAFAPLVEPDASELALAIDLYTRHQRLQSFDALLAAVALSRNADALVTADRAFLEIPELRVLDPRSPEIARMLA